MAIGISRCSRIVVQGSQDVNHGLPMTKCRVDGLLQATVAPVRGGLEAMGKMSPLHVPLGDRGQAAGDGFGAGTCRLLLNILGIVL